MRTEMNLLRRHALLSAVMVIFGSCGAVSASAEVPVDEPARAIPFAGALADSFLDGTWADEGVEAFPGDVLVTGGNGTTKIFVFERTMAGAMEKLQDLAVYGDVEGCSEGTCCDLETGEWLAHAQHESDVFWLRLKERCEPSPIQEGWTDDEPSTNELGVPFRRVNQTTWNALTQEGVTHRVMRLTGQNHEGQVLVAPSWKVSEYRPQEGSPFILASHIKQPPPGGCATVSYCKSPPNRRCNADVHPTSQPHGNTKSHHWYSKDDTGDWCEEAATCSCQP